MYVTTAKICGRGLRQEITVEIRLDRSMVGPCRLELQTSCVSSRRSNQLSYGPLPTKSTLHSQHFNPRIPIPSRVLNDRTVSKSKYSVIQQLTGYLGLPKYVLIRRDPCQKRNRCGMESHARLSWHRFNATGGSAHKLPKN